MEPVEILINMALAKRDPISGLMFFLQNYLAHWARHKRELVFFFLTISRVLDNIRLVGHMEKYSNEMIGLYERLFSDCVKKGLMIEHDSHSHAVCLMSALDGVLMYIALNRNFAVDETYANFENVFIKPLLTGNGK